MKYVLSPAQLIPDVVSELYWLPLEKLQEGQVLRHPADTFIVVFRELLESGIQVCHDHQLALATPGSTAESGDVDMRLRRSLRGFHTCLADYANACKTVILSVRTGKEVDRGSRAFRAATNPYYDHVAMVENFIKHQHRVLRTVYARWPDGQIVGYQVEAALGMGAVGAEPKIHRYPGTAFSLNRSLKYHACHIYLMAAALQTILDLPKAEEKKRFAELEKLAATFLGLVADIPMLYFPDEQKLPVPLVKKRVDGTFLLECPSSATPINRKPHEMNLNFTFHVSAHAATVEIPYLGLKRPWERQT